MKGTHYLSERAVKRLIDYYSSGEFKPTAKNSRIVTRLIEVFVRTLQEQAEIEMLELNQLRSLDNRRVRKTIPSSIYKRVSEQLISKGISSYPQGEVAQYSSDTTLSEEVTL